MRRMILITLSILNLSLISRAGEERSPIDLLGQKVFNALQAKDEDAMASLCLLEKEEILALLKRNSPKTNEAQKEIESAINNIDAIAEGQKNTFKKGWENILKGIQETGIDMTTAQYVGVDARILPSEGHSIVKQVKIIFSIQEKQFAVHCSDLYFSGNEWKLEDPPNRVEAYSPRF